MTEIYLIRHAQAEGNLYHMLQGHWDGNVTALGMKQIAALAKRFKDVKVDRLYSSDLLRTRLTASAITKYHDLPLITDARLREINIGPWETQFMGNVVHKSPELFKVFIGDPENFCLEGAETYKQVGVRALEAVNEIVARHPGESIVIVTHGITLRCILSEISGISLNDVETLPIFKNTGIAHLCHDGEKYITDYLNDASHLTGELLPAHQSCVMRHECVDPNRDAKFYCDCYEDSWFTAHGDLKDFSASVYLNSACHHYEDDHESVYHFYVGDEDGGLLDLDTARGAHAGYGWISLLYLKPEYRGRNCGIQLLGRAITKYQALGRRAIRLNVSEDNTAAMAFYERWGFEKLTYSPGSHGRLWLMEKKL